MRFYGARGERLFRPTAARDKPGTGCSRNSHQWPLQAAQGDPIRSDSGEWRLPEPRSGPYNKSLRQGNLALLRFAGRYRALFVQAPLWG